MQKDRATSAEWSAYYERADRIRSVVGDPFRKHVRRTALRERVVLAASAVLMLTAVAAFGFLTMR
jgi:hypothetical protein